MLRARAGEIQLPKIVGFVFGVVVWMRMEMLSHRWRQNQN